jgi:hypothetical protein
MRAFECLYQIIPFDKPAHYKHRKKWTLFLHFEIDCANMNSVDFLNVTAYF